MRCLKNGLIIQVQEGYSVRPVGPGGRRGERKQSNGREEETRGTIERELENESCLNVDSHSPSFSCPKRLRDPLTLRGDRCVRERRGRAHFPR